MTTHFGGDGCRQHPELISLLADYIDGALGAVGQQRLTALLTNDAAARATYVEYLDLHLALRKRSQQQRIAGAAQPADLPHGNACAAQSSPAHANAGWQARWLTNSATRVAANKRRALGAMLSLAIVLYGGFGLLVWQMKHDTLRGVAGVGSFNPPESPFATVAPNNSPQAVARVVALQNCVWDAGQSCQVGDSLTVGTLHISQGKAELEFADGARVVLAGPGRFVLSSASSGYLAFGTVVAEVPQRAVGFRIGTPQAQVVDLGTKFGVTVSQAGNTDVHVLQGEVETTPVGKLPGDGAASATRLNAGQSVRIESSGTVRSLPAASHLEFADAVATSSAMPAAVATTYSELILADRPLAYWPMNEPPGARTIADVSGNGHTGTVHGTVEFGVPGVANAEQGAEGLSPAARFSGQGWIELARPETLALTDSFTVEAWLRPQADKSIGRVLSIDPGISKSGWGFGYLPQGMQRAPRDGLLFTLYSKLDYPLVPPDNIAIADGNWRHVLILCDGAPNAYLFIDGKAVALYEGSQRGIVGAVKAAIGRHNDGKQSYHGDVAHLAIYPHMLSEAKIALRYRWLQVSLPEHPSSTKQ